tara:strand:+ start:654 stop:986 length:333 start_codon:yes stop_codon:yes gene_type:complete
MIEANEPTNGTVVKQTTPAKITTTQIIEDLENGINRDGIKEKYGLETWMVAQMFQHPTLKGKKAKKVRVLPFEFVDDSAAQVDENQTEIPLEEVELDSFDSEEDNNNDNF